LKAGDLKPAWLNHRGLGNSPSQRFEELLSGCLGHGLNY